MYEINNGKDMSHDAKRQSQEPRSEEGQEAASKSKSIGKEIWVPSRKAFGPVFVFCFLFFSVQSCKL